MDKQEDEIQVGDELAFDCGGLLGWQIEKVTKITPTGRIVCGRYTLNADLTIRGASSFGYWGPYRGQRVTPKIAAHAKRQRQLAWIKTIRWNDLDNDQLDEISAHLRKVIDSRTNDNK